MSLGQASTGLTREGGQRKVGPEGDSEGADEGFGEGPGGGGLTSETQSALRDKVHLCGRGNREGERGHFDSMVQGND